jgi:hypothetical protein
MSFLPVLRAYDNTNNSFGLEEKMYRTLYTKEGIIIDVLAGEDSDQGILYWQD